MLLIPSHGRSHVEWTSNVADTTVEFGHLVTASATPHTVGAYTQLSAATSYDAWGVTVSISDIGSTASTNTRSLVNIAAGAATAEVVIIPNLLCGQAGAWSSASIGPVMYHFPIKIPAGTRIAANMQTLAASDTCRVSLWLHEHQIAGRWYGQRVTAYGADTADSGGTAHTHGNSGYATTTQLSASTTNPIKYLQVGIDLGVDTTGNTKRGLLRIAGGSSTNYLVSNLPFKESTTLEAMDSSYANMILSHMQFNLPAASYLGVGAMMNATGEARDFVLYGVD